MGLADGTIGLRAPWSEFMHSSEPHTAQGPPPPRGALPLGRPERLTSLHVKVARPLYSCKFKVAQMLHSETPDLCLLYFDCYPLFGWIPWGLALEYKHLPELEMIRLH